MLKWTIALSLFALYAAYSGWIYSEGTQSKLAFSEAQQARINKGKQLYQEYNCQACHQIYGLGGYLGPELTTAYSDPKRGEAFMNAMLISGGERMPRFNFTEPERKAILAYLAYVDATTHTNRY